MCGTGLVEIWNSSGTTTGKASLWGLDLTLQQRWGARMMGDRDEKVAIGTYVSQDVRKPSDPITVEMKDRSVLRKSEWNKLIKPRLLPPPAHYRQVCKFERGHKKMVIWEAVAPSPHYLALSMLATATEDMPGGGDMCCVPSSWCVESDMRLKVWEDEEGRGLYIINSLGLLAASSKPYMPPAGPFYDIKKELRTGHKFALGHPVNAGILYQAAGTSRSLGTTF